MRVRVKLEEDGRLTIPPAYLEALGVEAGGELVLVLEANELRVRTPQDGIRRAQALVHAYNLEGRCLADELIEERRRVPG